MREQLETRMKEIQAAVEQSVQNHGSLLGRMAEAQHFLSMLDESEKKEEDEPEFD